MTARLLACIHLCVAVAASLACVACGSAQKQDDEVARNTWGCDLAGERLVIRYDQGEARLLLPDGERTNLYQVPSGAGTRYTNGTLDLIGKMPDLKLARNGGTPVPVTGCALVAPPK